MAPSLGCLSPATLMCAEKSAGQGINTWKDGTIESFNEQHQHLQGPFVTDKQSTVHMFIPCDHLLEEEDEAIEQLIQKEASFMLHKEYAESYNGIDDTEMQESRERAVYWMLTVQAYYGFNPCTPCLAVSYFDRFLANQQENLLLKSRTAPWLLQLLAVGCMSLAVKVEETEVPLLLDLQVGHVPHVFEARTIQRMELLILSTLKWRLSSVTPFSFIGFLLQKMRFLGRSCCYNVVISCVEELILNSCGDPRFVVYSPSVLAMASMMCACDELLCGQAASSCKHALLSIWPNRENITVECAALMQELIVGADHPFWTLRRKLIASPPNSTASAPESPNGVLDAACFSCESGNSTACSLLIPTKSQVLRCSGPVDCTSFRSAMAKAATYSTYPSSPSPSVCKTRQFCSRKRKLNETYNTVCTRTASRRGEPEIGPN